MSDRTRILLLEPNRYRALLISRCLIGELESVVLARFESGPEAFEELASNNYDIVMLNLIAIGSRPVSALAELVSACPDIRIIVSIEPDTPRKVRSQINDLNQARLTCIELSESVMPEAITAAIRSAVGIDQFGKLTADESVEAELVG